MAQDRKRTFERLSAIWNDNKTTTLKLAEFPKLAIVSDLHLGNGGEADDLRRNVSALRAALRSYEKEGFSMVLLGDIEELWQFDLEKVVDEYAGTVYADLIAFGNGRVFRIFGNHDIEWFCPSDPATGTGTGKGFPEAIKLATDDGPRALLVHGHQGTLPCARGFLFHTPQAVDRYMPSTINRRDRSSNSFKFSSV